MPMSFTSQQPSAAALLSSPFRERTCAKGDLLFQIDPLPYRLVVEQTTADLGIARFKRFSRNRPDKKRRRKP